MLAIHVPQHFHGADIDWLLRVFPWDAWILPFCRDNLDDALWDIQWSWSVGVPCHWGFPQEPKCGMGHHCNRGSVAHGSSDIRIFHRKWGVACRDLHRLDSRRLWFGVRLLAWHPVYAFWKGHLVPAPWILLDLLGNGILDGVSLLHLRSESVYWTSAHNGACDHWVYPQHSGLCVNSKESILMSGIGESILVLLIFTIFWTKPF